LDLDFQGKTGRFISQTSGGMVARDCSNQVDTFEFILFFFIKSSCDLVKIIKKKENEKKISCAEKGVEDIIC
jgi:hypothetical protein